MSNFDINLTTINLGDTMIYNDDRVILRFTCLERIAGVLALVAVGLLVGVLMLLDWFFSD